MKRYHENVPHVTQDRCDTEEDLMFNVTVKTTLEELAHNTLYSLNTLSDILEP
jgi:hypothetical protein